MTRLESYICDACGAVTNIADVYYKTWARLNDQQNLRVQFDVCPTCLQKIKDGKLK